MQALISFQLFVYFLRELAYQIADQFRVFGKHIGLRDTVIVGGIGKLILVIAEFHTGGGGLLQHFEIDFFG